MMHSPRKSSREAPPAHANQLQRAKPNDLLFSSVAAVLDAEGGGEPRGTAATDIAVGGGDSGSVLMLQFIRPVPPGLGVCHPVGQDLQATAPGSP